MSGIRKTDGTIKKKNIDMENLINASLQYLLLNKRRIFQNIERVRGEFDLGSHQGVKEAHRK